MKNIFKRKSKPRWLVKNTHSLEYAGEEGGWVLDKETAKRFNDFEDARFVSRILTISTFATCTVTQDL